MDVNPKTLSGRSEKVECFSFIANLEGQYIIKNLVLVSAGLVVGATVRGGRIIHDSAAAQMAVEAQALSQRRGAGRGR